MQTLKDAALAKDSGKKKLTNWETFKAYLWLMWDGLVFFGFDDTKLARLNGKRTSVFDKFRNKKWVLSSIMVLIIVVYVIFMEISKLGEIKL